MKNIILLILCVLVGLNLILTLKINHQISGKSATQIETKSTNPLPDSVTKQSITALVKSIVDAHNSQDIEAQWDLYGEYAQAQMKLEEFSKSLISLYDLFGPITDAKFMYHEYAGKTGNLTFYNLFYKANLTDYCKLTETATMKVTIAIDGSDTQLVGCRIDSDS